MKRSLKYIEVLKIIVYVIVKCFKSL